MEISFTRFRIYRECPWKYKLMFVDGRRIPATPPAALGLALHRALENFHRAKSEDVSFLLQCYEREAPEGLYEKGRRILEKYFENDRARRTNILGIEREFVYPLGRHTVRGMVDRIDERPDGGIEIIDYKTQYSDEMQMRFYALGIRECLGIKPALLTFYYLSAGKSETKAYDDSNEDGLKRLIVQTADRIEAGEFKADTSFCSRCDFRNSCQFSVARDG